MPALIREDQSQMIVGLGVVRLDGERPLVALCRIADLSRRAIRFSQIAVCVRIGWPRRSRAFRMGDGAADVVDGVVMAPRIMRDRAEEAERVEVFGIGDQDLAIGLFRFGQSPGAVVRNAGRDRPRYVGLS